MSVSVEFYGITRQRAGTATATAVGQSLGDVLCDLADRFPHLAETCFDGQRLKPGFVANVDGQRFVSDPRTPLDGETHLLILSADVGG